MTHSTSLSADARPRALATLARDTFDVLVIGGGITGAGVARDAAMRGLTVALVERDDFASGTSSRSSRLVHGGLRYLEHAEIGLVYEASRERRTLLAIAPHLVRPLEFLWPLYEKARVPPWKVRAGLLLYDALALFRNIGTHRALDARRVAALEPALRQAGLLGGERYFDAATDDARLTIATVRAAVDAGAVAINHAAVRDLVIDATGVRATVVDALDGGCIAISARVAVNATGPWSDDIRRLADPGAAPSVRGTKGVHVAVPRDRVRNNGALTILSPIDGRVMFILPAGWMTIIGTTDTDFSGPPEAARATAEDVAYLLRSANAYFPSAHLAPADVVSAWAGIRPLVASHDGEPGRVSREHAIGWTRPRLLSVSGGKLTTYRAMAAEVVDEVASALGARAPRAPTASVPLPGGCIASLEEEIETARRATGTVGLAEHLVHAYGTEWRDVWAMVGSNHALAAAVAPGLPYIVAELHWAVEREMALTLADLLTRRLHVAFETRDHGMAAAPAVARVVAPLLGWRAERIERELASYDREIARMFRVDG
ncbi:MAG TPA: glycerol-3-phosphate dehydrogenase [Gemmatimonadaceae bacterium]